jgi:hypothetical protein
MSENPETPGGKKLIFGCVKGYVRDNVDPQVRNRVRCYCPQVMGAGSDTPGQWLGWAEPCLPWIGGVNTQDFGPPSTKDQNDGQEVILWLIFEMGDPDFPVYLGTVCPVPTPTDPNAALDLANAASQDGGSDIENPVNPGSNVAALSPAQPVPGTREVRLTTKPGVDLFLGSKQGGGIIIGASGVHTVGIQITHNGKPIVAMDADE